jgi:tRNA pseudouridine55 synthase
VIDGALLLDKPVGLSSNTALQEAKRLLAAKKAGHGGTLDPLASGLLVILFGEGTKFAGPMLDADKEYLATVKLGERTDTGDAEGAIVERHPVAVTAEDVAKAFARFRGAIEQVPPMHSALKHEGVPLYKIARKGGTVERQPRRVVIHDLELLARKGDLLEIRARVSKGTYIRTLAEDIGAALGCGAHLAALRRTGSGRFSVRDAVTLDELRDAPDRRTKLRPLASLLDGLPRTELDAAGEARLRNGQSLKISDVREGVRALYRVDGAVIGLGYAAPEGVLKALRLTSGVSQAAEKSVKIAGSKI